MRYRRCEEVDDSKVGDRIVLYHRSSRKAVVLNPVGSWLWTCLSAPQTVEALAGKLQNKYSSLTSERAANDVSAFLNDLLQHEIIRIE